MSDFTILQEWDIAKLTGVQMPVLGGLASDLRRGLLWSTERTSNRVLQLDLSNTNTHLSHRLDIDDTGNLGDLTVDDTGRLYVCDQGKSKIYILEEAPNVKKIITLATPVSNIESFPGGGVLTTSRLFLPQKLFHISRYSSEGEEMWRWNCPAGVSQAVAIAGEAGSTFVVTQSEKIRVHQLDGNGVLLDTHEIANAKNTPVTVWTKEGAKSDAMSVNLHDAEAGFNPATLFVLYTPPQWKRLHEIQLIVYSRGAGLQTFVIPYRCWRIVRLEAGEMAAYWNNVTEQVCKIFTFSLPTVM